MASRRNDASTLKEEQQSRRQERADRILDAAAELVLRWGYKKTTIDDIARQAGVAKGTIYLHWKAREDLLVALLTREDLKLTEDIKRRIASDPEGATLRGFVKHTTLALMKNPLMKALLLNDIEMLGEFARREYRSATYAERIKNFTTFLEFLRSHGVVRADVGMREQAYILSAVWVGFLLVDPWMPDELKFSDEKVVEMLADAVQLAIGPRTTATGEPVETGPSQELSNALTQYIDQDANTIKELQKEVEA